MKKLTSVLHELPEFKRVLTAIDSGRCPAAVSGLAPVHRAHFAAGVRAETGRPIVMVCADEEEGDRLERDLEALTGERAVRLTAREFSFYDGYSSKQWEHKRLAAFRAMLAGEAPVVVATVESLLQRTIPPALLDRASFVLDPKKPISLEEAVDRLGTCGYSRCEQVEGVGQFAQRGGILDVFSPAYDRPVRVEYWDTDIDSMGLFDLMSQRRTETLQEAVILPAGEVLPGLSGNPDALGGDLHLPEIYPQMATAADYFPPDAVVFLSESGRVSERGEHYLWQLDEDVKTLIEKERLGPKPGAYARRMEELTARLEDWPVVYLDSFAVSGYPARPKTLLSIMAKQLPSFGGSLETAVSDLAHYQRSGYAVTVLVASEQRALNLQGLLREEKVRAAVDFALHDLPQPGQAVICVGGLTAGVEYPDLKCAILTQGSTAPVKKKRRHIQDKSNRQKLNSYADLRPGDLVVHSQYGIGRFVELAKMRVDDVDKEYMKIAYAGTDVLYVPITQLDQVNKYIGGGEDGANRKLSRLGGGDWDKAKSKAKGAVAELAKGLVQLYAQRQRLPGFAFSPDSPWQKEFEDQFAYTETEDQLRCVAEIKKDMEKPQPMDRLLCGDVGYGKTEVAFRAIMKCVLDGKQAAILVPTTVLARQHFLTAKARFAKYPVNIASLSRFNTPAQTRDVLQNLKDGRVDLLVGTHRLLQKDVEFKDLGLLVVDEEQRFGVTHKEKLKELCKQVDVLTLSATPIPRTLNMALSGIRDMSTLEEPPSDRQPVQTYVLEHDWPTVADAIRREVERGGQVYYLHNRIDTIARCAQRLHEQLGDSVSIAVAHGRMTQEEINNVMTDLSEGNVDVLVCTTIIETGIDVPNVNTLIIENADNLGLAQLHQIRGRVGRSSRRAVAYLTYKKGKVLDQTAAKRLSAIREFAEFGSGFKIAMRDLEIRGAGNILGPEQSGFMVSVGYDMYLQLLEEAVLEERGEAPAVKTECAADLSVSAAIPDRYVPQAEQRMDLYRRIAAIRSEEEADDLTDELIDRYGDPPRQVNNLIAVALMRAVAAQNGISEITQKGQTVVFSLAEVDLQRLSKLCSGEKYQTRVRFAPGEKPNLTLRLKRGEDPLRWGSKLVEDYAKTKEEAS